MKYFCELTNMKTGEVLLFNSCAEASDYLNKSKTYVAKCLDRNIPVYGEDKQRYTAAVYKKLKVKAIEAPQPTAQKGKAPKKPVKQEKPKDKPPEINRRIQLCCFCKKSCGGCSWSKKFEPVEGWTAEPTIIRQRNRQGKYDIHSYKITECPQYEKG